ncbi:uncharacterized protein LOC117647577 [Thrips palmi]|uniref:Uncharacterized protein LOC117647577 n=1 Tax=Thrips palmi TaxID=161013 RepID=A0A6P8ZBK5_THRPL|nr:uncharacterized protein LOC117647577 [Thrips palmi]XP_034245293.1 uncharacterized protein LOC117647577 [Thrips palmi]XP_034245294.1 uncharacterized protein LOC117647577 [Thrips palmi]
MSAPTKLISCFTKPNPFSKRFSSQVQNTEKPAQQSLGGTTSETPKDYVQVSAARKRMFVMAGLFKSAADCPDKMTLSSMSKNMDRFRVRASLVIMGLSALGALSSIMLAKGVVDDFEEKKRKAA